MTRDPYGGSIWDPASLHRYNYARANPVNYIDPSGRADLTEYEFALVDVLPTIGEVAFVGQQVACDYSVMASILDIIFDAPYANGEQMQLASIQLDKSLGKCGVKATWQGNLLNVGIGVAAALATEGFSRLLGDAAEGFSLRFLTEEEGSFGFEANEVEGVANAGNSGVTVYRVEGLPNTRIIIGDGGQVSVQGDQMLFLNFDDQARAQQFLATRLEQGMPGVQMKSFQVPQSFLTDLQEAAVPESMARQFPNSPLLVDPTMAPNQFGLRADQIQALQNAIVQGTGKVY